VIHTGSSGSANDQAPRSRISGTVIGVIVGCAVLVAAALAALAYRSRAKAAAAAKAASAPADAPATATATAPKVVGTQPTGDSTGPTVA